MTEPRLENPNLLALEPVRRFVSNSPAQPRDLTHTLCLHTLGPGRSGTPSPVRPALYVCTPEPRAQSSCSHEKRTRGNPEAGLVICILLCFALRKPSFVKIHLHKSRQQTEELMDRISELENHQKPAPEWPYLPQ